MKEKYSKRINGWVLNLFIESITHFVNSKVHNDTGPALIYDDGYQAWFQDGKKHRLKGPAIIHECYNCSHLEWWIEGNFLDEKKKPLAKRS